MSVLIAWGSLDAAARESRRWRSCSITAERLLTESQWDLGLKSVQTTLGVKLSTWRLAVRYSEGIEGRVGGPVLDESC